MVENSQPAELRKAAVLLASLPDDDRSFLLRELDERQVEKIAQIAATQEPPRVAEQDAIAREFEHVDAERAPRFAVHRHVGWIEKESLGTMAVLVSGNAASGESSDRQGRQIYLS